MTRGAVGVLIAAIVSVATVACGESDDDAVELSLPDSIATDGSKDDVGGLAERFDAVRVRVIDADGITCGLCLWLADSASQRQQGLMGVTDLEGASGMVFVFETPSTTGFWMRNTVLPLDVAYYDSSGAFVSRAAMDPCPPDVDDCPRYTPASSYSLAIEVPAGQAEVFGMEPGGRAVIDGPCDPSST